MLDSCSLAIVELGHSSNTSATQSRILIAVSPAVHSSLDQSSLATEAWVELSQSPSHRVTLSLVNQAVTAVLVLAAAGTRIDAVLGLELGAQAIDIN